MTTRSIQVTNDNSLINYEPDNAWRSIPSTSEMFQVGNMGVPLSSSLVLTQNGNISFSFNGVETIVMVTYLPTTTESDQSPAANCKVDDITINLNIPQSPQNNWAICDSGSLPDGEHTLTFDIPNSEAGSSIYFDYILYAPSPTQPDIPTSAIRIEATDPSITYLGGFAVETDTGSTRLANGRGQGMTIPFVGEQLTWYGAYSTLLPSNPSSAEYSVDGGTPKQFALSGPGKDGTLLNQVLFQTEALPQGPHKLTATCLGDGQTALGLSFVVVQNISNTAPTQSFPDVTGVSNTISSRTTSAAFSQPTFLRSQSSTLDIGRSSQPSSTTSLSIPVQSTSTPASISIPGQSKSTPATPPSDSQSTPTKSSSKSNILIGIIVGLSILFFVIVAVFLLRRRGPKLFALIRETKLKGAFKISPYRWRTQTDTSDSLGIHRQSQSSLPILGNNTASEKLSLADRFETWEINSPINRSSNAISTTMFNISSFPTAIEEEEQMAENPRRVSQTERVSPILDDATNLGSLERIGRSNPFIPMQEVISVGPAVNTAERITSLPLSLNGTPGTDERHADSGIRLHRQLFYDDTDSEISWRSKDRLPPEYTRD